MSRRPTEKLSAVTASSSVTFFPRGLSDLAFNMLGGGVASKASDRAQVNLLLINHRYLCSGGRGINRRRAVTVVCGRRRKVNLVVRCSEWIEVPPAEGGVGMEKRDYKRTIDHIAGAPLISPGLSPAALASWPTEAHPSG